MQCILNQWRLTTNVFFIGLNRHFNGNTKIYKYEHEYEFKNMRWYEIEFVREQSCMTTELQFISIYQKPWCDVVCVICIYISAFHALIMN